MKFKKGEESSVKTIILRKSIKLYKYCSTNSQYSSKSLTSPDKVLKAFLPPFLHSDVSLPSQDTPPGTQDRLRPKKNNSGQKYALDIFTFGRHLPHMRCSSLQQKMGMDATLNIYFKYFHRKRRRWLPPRGKLDTQAPSLRPQSSSQSTPTIPDSSCCSLVPL